MCVFGFNIKRRSFIGGLFLAVLIVVGPLTLSAAGPVSFNSDTTYLIGSFTLTVLSGSTAVSVTTSSTSLTVTTEEGDVFNITSAARSNFSTVPAVNITCTDTISKVTISGAKTVVITPLSTICSSGGAGGGGPSPSPSPPLVPPTTPAPPPSSADGTGLEIKEEEELKFKDVSETQAKTVYPVVDLMLKYRTYSFPKTRKFGVKSVTKGGFAVQTALAAKGHTCGSDEKYLGIKSCAKEATKLKLINSKFPTGKVQRWEYYNLLLKAKGIPLEDVGLADLRKECSDLDGPTKEKAKIFFTAREYGIASKYKGGKCRLHLGFSKYEAAKFALRANQIQEE